MINFNRLREIREDHDLSQKQMAEILNTNRSTYSLWELGINIIPLKELCNFADYFRISLDYILNISNYKNSKNYIEKLNLETLGYNMKKIRIQNHLSQEEIADIIGVSQACVNKYEKGKITISVPVLYTFCKNFDISLNHLCGKTKEEIIHS